MTLPEAIHFLTEIEVGWAAGAGGGDRPPGKTEQWGPGERAAGAPGGVASARVGRSDPHLVSTSHSALSLKPHSQPVRPLFAGGEARSTRAAGLGPGPFGPGGAEVEMGFGGTEGEPGLSAGSAYPRGRSWTCGRTPAWSCPPSLWTVPLSGTTSTSHCRTSCGWRVPPLPQWPRRPLVSMGCLSGPQLTHL